MNWKQALFIGGSLLVLAACDQATAPQPQLTQTNHRAAVHNNNNNNNNQTLPQTITPQSLDCRSGYSVSSGKSGCDQ